jgi:hypothetical protein
VTIEHLDGRPTSRGLLRVGELRPGRYPEEADAVVYAGEETAIRLKHFAGRWSTGAPPWIEAALAHTDEVFTAELVAALAELLPPGGRLMVGYGDDETERGLERRFPPVVTPLGKALLDAGCTWFKNWYYPEGWREGESKLQGNKPVSDEARSANLADLRREVEAWLTGSSGTARDALAARAQARARALLECR